MLGIIPGLSLRPVGQMATVAKLRIRPLTRVDAAGDSAGAFAGDELHQRGVSVASWEPFAVLYRWTYGSL